MKNILNYGVAEGWQVLHTLCISEIVKARVAADACTNAEKYNFPRLKRRNGQLFISIRVGYGQSAIKIIVTATTGDDSFFGKAQCIGYGMSLLVDIGKCSQPACTMQNHRNQNGEGNNFVHGGK